MRLVPPYSAYAGIYDDIGQRGSDVIRHDRLYKRR